jgi:hypothetical protein
MEGQYLPKMDEAKESYSDTYVRVSLQVGKRAGERLRGGGAGPQECTTRQGLRIGREG